MRVGIPMVHGPEDFLQPLVAILRRAHAGELAAFLAYEGHWRSLKDPRERDEVKAIAREELEHRKCLGLMLDDLGYRPAPSREAWFWLIGTAIGGFCRVGGWLAPMYGAGLLERGNVEEYEEAAGLAMLAGRGDLAPDLLRMAETEWKHERYFRSRVLERRRGLARLLPLWRSPPPRVAARRLPPGPRPVANPGIRSAVSKEASGRPLRRAGF
ncbi:MAG: ferritin-like domain-containing protein [Vicinamibacteria bacterium]